MRKLLACVLLLVFAVACDNAQEVTEMPDPTPSPEPSAVPPPTLATVEIVLDIAYVEDGDYYQKLDVYLPEGAETSLPTLVVIHGGGDHRDGLADLARFFAARGYAVVSIDHRAYPQSVYPAQVEDAFCALAWVHANADSYGFDVTKVSALGHSSGGTLVAMYGVVDNPDQFLQGCAHQLPGSGWVRSIVPFTGIFDFVTAAEDSDGLYNYSVTYLGGDQSEAPDVWTEASAVTWIDGSEPPFFLIHGEDDTNILPAQSEDFALALSEAGVYVELVVVPGATHGVIASSEEVLEAVISFLVRVMD